MIIDFAVSPTDYPRLSKLVLFAALSAESKILAERLQKARVRSVRVKYSSRRPASMKYRGLFRIADRHKFADGEGEKRFELEYRSALGGWTLPEAFAMWRKRYDK